MRQNNSYSHIWYGLHFSQILTSKLISNLVLKLSCQKQKCDIEMMIKEHFTSTCFSLAQPHASRGNMYVNIFCTKKTEFSF